jgi:hypothetical protein
MRVLILAGLLVLGPAASQPVAAQSAPPTLRASNAQLSGLAELRVTALASTAAEAALNTNVVVATKQRRQGTVLMIVGAAVIVTGLIVDEPIVTIGGAVVGGIGLYMFLDSGGEVRVGALRRGPAGP